jgi:hypothetical protein
MDFEAKKRAVEKAQQDLKDAVADERKRLLTERANIDKKLAELDALAGTFSPTARGKRRTGVRASVLECVASNPKGIKKGPILEALGAKGDKSAENSIGTAISNLKKAGKITRSEDGLYKVAP